MKVRQAKPRESGYRIPDAGGLHLFVTPSGSKLWRVRYKIDGKEKLLSLGSYPEISLAAAREARDQAKAAKRRGVDPSALKRAGALQPGQAPPATFEVVAREWHAVKAPSWKPHHAADVLASLEREIFPTIGALPLPEITTPMVLEALRRVEKRGAVDLAHRLRQRISHAFQFHIASTGNGRDPAAHLSRAMTPIDKSGRRPAVTTIARAREVLQACEQLPAFPVTRLALRLLALTLVRPGEVRGAVLDEFEDLDGQEPTWRIPPERMKSQFEHVVPLSTHAVDVVKEATRLAGRGPLLFPSTRQARRPLSENAIGYLMNRAGFRGEHVAHGWRATGSTVLNERYPADRQAIDLMLAHGPKDPVEGAYNRALHRTRRRELAQIWADMLLEGMPNAEQIATAARR
ncbi:tyrosine-type recombinase/integrase [Neoroseomonas terrae]|uniref:tyrosine-type recombinase/integrase n=1 Tax=Neoroseomonas terrae TaxID=424799 RepID=UPI0030B9D31B